MSQIQSIKLSNYFEEPMVSPIIKARKWLLYDIDNLFPQRLLTLRNAPTHASILAKTVDYCIGEGLKYDETDLELKHFIETCSLDQNLDEIMRRCFNDLVIFNGFCLNLVSSENNTSYIQAIQHIPFQNVRVGFPDDFNFIDSYFISNNWYYFTNKKFRAQEYKAFKNSSFEGNAIMYNFVYDSELRYYPKPSYFAACNYIALEDELSRFYLNFVENNMVPSFSITFPHDATEEQKADNARSIQDFYSGGSNAGKVLILYGEPNASGTGQAPLVNVISQSNSADVYKVLHETTLQNIFTAHQLPSPVLAGIPGAGNLGGNGQEIATAYEVYYNTVICKYQKIFLDKFKSILRFNKLSDKVEIINKPPITSIYSEAFLTSVLTLEEKRTLLGYDNLEAATTEDTVDTNITTDTIVQDIDNFKEIYNLYKIRYNEK